MTITGGRLNVNKAITSCGPSDFLISPGPAYRVITAASQAQFNINVQSIAGFSGNVSMSVEGLPQGATASFTNPSIMTQGGSVLTVNTDASVRPGRYQLHIVGTSSALQRFGVVLLDLPEYSVQDIGTLPGHTDARATAINNAGQIVGYSYPTFGDNHPFLYSSGLLQGLAPNGGQGVPTAINNQGHVVGTLANPFSGFIHKDGQTTLLPTTLNNEVNSINDLDQITGTVRNAQSLPRVFVYSPGGTVADIGLGNGFGINASSQVAGGTLVDGDYQARLYANGNLIALGLPLNRISIATAINNSGQIAGWVVDDVDGGFFYNNGIANRFGTSSSKPEAINSSGMIVGDNGNQAFMYRNGILNNVNEVIPVDSRSYLVDAHGVNDLGQIAATYFAGDHTRACLISPVALSGLPAQRPPTVIMSNPAAGSSWIDPAKIPLLATVVGDNISKVDFFVDGTLIGTSTTYPYGFIWRTNIVPGFRRFTAVATTIDGQTFASGPNRVSIYYSELQPPFNHSDVGVVGIAGHATALYGNQGTFTLHGSGADIGGTADAFHFVYQILSGDGEVVTRVSTLEPTDPDA
jgi:probable HAF family extracellular repeat protein